MNTLRLHRRAEPLSPALVKRFSQVHTATVSDSLERSNGSPGLLPIGDCLRPLNGLSMAGTALTVRTRPGDNLVVHKALDLLRPGDVLVVDARGETVNAILGGLMSTYAATRGAVGIVVDGAVRDSAEISDGRIPIFARGVCHLGPYKSGPGEIHGAVTIGGVVVRDGDVALGDADGVAFVARARAEEAIDGAEAIMAKEREQHRAIDEGRWDRSWVDAALHIVEV